MSYNREARIGDTLCFYFLGDGLTPTKIAICQACSNKYFDFDNGQFDDYPNITTGLFDDMVNPSGGPAWTYTWDTLDATGCQPGEYLIFASGVGIGAWYEIGCLVLSGTIIQTLDELRSQNGSQEVIIQYMFDFPGHPPGYLPDVRTEIQTSDGASIVAVKYSDVYGKVTFWLQPETNYRIIPRASGWTFYSLTPPVPLNLGVYSATPVYEWIKAKQQTPDTPDYPDVCTVFGNLIMPNGQIPPEGTKVKFRLYELPTTYGSGANALGITNNAIIATTDSEGYFSAPIIRNIKIKMSCEVTGDTRVFIIGTGVACPVNYKSLTDLC